MIRKLKVFLIICIFSASCSNTNNSNNLTKDIDLRSPEEIYISAMNFFDNQNYAQANSEFIELNKLYPLSNEAIQAEIMIGFLSYLSMDYDTSILQFQKIINKYPSHKNLDYVYYMRAMCNYEQITHHELDGSYNELALSNFNELILRFPNSNYSKDARQKIVLIKSNKAAKHLEIGRFYLKEKKYTAALNRFSIIINDYSDTKFVPEALHRMVETYFDMGMYDDSLKMASTLGYNYPDSKWYEYSYNLLKNVESNTTVLDKIKNFF